MLTGPLAEYNTKSQLLLRVAVTESPLVISLTLCSLRMFNPLSDTFSIPSQHLFSGYFVSAIRGMTFLPTFCHFTGQISYPFDFIS